MPPPNLVTSSVQTFFNLRVGFDYNSSQYADGVWGIVGSPRLWLLVYDPVIPAQQAYLTGTAGLSLINVNGFNSVTLTPTYVQRRDSPPHYDWNAVTSTISGLNLVCDVSTHTNASSSIISNAYRPCYGTIAFRYATLERMMIRERPTMELASVVASVGLAWTGMDTDTEVAGREIGA
ncbi:MAG: hypothetical protein Q9160_000788 [Pyrenula sp. 1 TL-2023]